MAQLSRNGSLDILTTVLDQARTCRAREGGTRGAGVAARDQAGRLPDARQRRTRLEAFLVGAPDSIRYGDHQIDHGPAFHTVACEHGLEGIVSKRVDGRYEPDRRSLLKVKWLK
jgi:hypothetical protein